MSCRRREVGPQFDGLLEILQRIVVVAQLRAGERPVGVGLRIDGILADGGREVGLGANQVVEVVFGDASQEVPLEGILVEAQQGVERTNRLLIVVLHHAALPHPEEILLVVLGTGLHAATEQKRSDESCDESTHVLPVSPCRF